MLIQTYFTAAVQALATAYRLWTQQQELNAEEPETVAETLDYALLDGTKGYVAAWYVVKA